MRDLFGYLVARIKKIVNCQHCGKEFTQTRKDQKYCRLNERIIELEAQLAAPPAPKKSKAKVLTS
jgi:hypothetical protein